MSEQIYYLESILRQLRHVKNDIDHFPSVSGEALYDNIDWLDFHIEELKKEQKSPTDRPGRALTGSGDK